MSAPPELNGPSVAATTGGACNAVGAIAGTSYAPSGGSDKGNLGRAAYRASNGRIWSYTGKRGRVLVMLAKAENGITQWDTLPWHTRLGSSIYAMRGDGLGISTELEGDFRHARYRLHTAGSLIVQGENREPRLFTAPENSQ